MKIKNWNQFNESVNESWKSFVAGCMLLFAASCDGIKMHDGSGKDVKLPYHNSAHKYTTTGVVQDVTRIPLKSDTQYEITVLDVRGIFYRLINGRLILLPMMKLQVCGGYPSLKRGQRLKLFLVMIAKFIF